MFLFVLLSWNTMTFPAEDSLLLNWPCASELRMCLDRESIADSFERTISLRLDERPLLAGTDFFNRFFHVLVGATGARHQQFPLLPKIAI